MPSYMAIVVLALATSNVPVALAAPIHYSREVRESLSRREDPPPEYPPQGHPPLGYPSPGQPAAHYQQSAYHPYGPTKVKIHLNVVPDKPVAKGSYLKKYAMGIVVGTAATVFGLSLLKGLWGSGSSKTTSAPASSSTSSTNNQYTPGPYPSSNPNPYNPTSTPQTGQNQYYGQNQNQRRAEDHGKRANLFEPSEAKLGSISDNNRRATSHLELLSRSELRKALELSSRVPDELD